MDAIVDNLEKRFPDMPLLEAFNVFNAQQWPECEEELQVFGNDSIEVTVLTIWNVSNDCIS